MFLIVVNIYCIGYNDKYNNVTSDSYLVLLSMYIPFNYYLNYLPWQFINNNIKKPRVKTVRLITALLILHNLLYLPFCLLGWYILTILPSNYH